MQVTHKQDFDTHAIIGGSNIVAFEVAQTAEFFEVLSSTLYSDKPLAVIREVTCNAWDAHVASGRTAKAIQVHVDEDELVIKDFGLGIPHDKIGQIYCTYGNSTKTNDGLQTGGFGLGSKAPFAYATHFSVTSCHAGVKTVYAISRGSSKTQGRPDCRIMYQGPTTDEGVEVKIPVKNATDAQLFKSIAERIISQGEMNAYLNDVLVETIPMSKSEEGFAFTRHAIGNSAHRIFVRYGNVIYPVDTNEEFEEDYRKVISFLDSMQDRRSYNQTWRVVFHADPNTISVTPSRESLSLSETTIETLKLLFKRISTDHNQKYADIYNGLRTDALDSYWKKGDYIKLLEHENMFTRITSYSEVNKEVWLLSYESAVKHVIANRYDSSSNAFRLELPHRLKCLIDGGAPRPHLLKEFSLLVSDRTNKETRSYYDKKEDVKLPFREFAARKILLPLIKKMIKADDIDIKKLYVVVDETEGTGRNFTRYKLKPVAEYAADIAGVCQLLKNTICVVTSRVSYSDYFRNTYRKEMDNHFGDLDYGQLIYLSSRTKGAIEADTEWFQKNTDKYVFDLGLRRGVIEEESRLRDLEYKRANPPPVKVKTPKVVGIPKLSMLVDGTGFNYRKHMRENVERITDPEFIIQGHAIALNSYQARFFKFGDSLGDIIVRLWGDKGGIPVNSRQGQTYIDKGAKDGYEYIGEKLFEEFQTNDRLLEYNAWGLASTLEHKGGHLIYQMTEILKVIPSLAPKMKLPAELTSEDQLYQAMWYILHPMHSDRRSGVPNVTQNTGAMLPHLHAIDKLIMDVAEKTAPQRKVVVDSLSNSMFELVDINKLLKVLKDPDRTQKMKDDAEALLLIAIQG